MCCAPSVVHKRRVYVDMGGTHMQQNGSPCEWEGSTTNIRTRAHTHTAWCTCCRLGRHGEWATTSGLCATRASAWKYPQSASNTAYITIPYKLAVAFIHPTVISSTHVHAPQTSTYPLVLVRSKSGRPREPGGHASPTRARSAIGWPGGPLGDPPWRYAAQITTTLRMLMAVSWRWGSVGP